MLQHVVKVDVTNLGGLFKAYIYKECNIARHFQYRISNAKVKLGKSNIDGIFVHTYLLLPPKMECNHFWRCNKNDG